MSASTICSVCVCLWNLWNGAKLPHSASPWISIWWCTPWSPRALQIKGLTGGNERDRLTVADKTLTIGVLCGLDAHVGLPFVQAWLPLSVLLLKGGLCPVLGVDVGQVRRGVVVGLQGVIVLDLDGKRAGKVREEFHLLEDFQMSQLVENGAKWI